MKKKIGTLVVCSTLLLSSIAFSFKDAKASSLVEYALLQGIIARIAIQALYGQTTRTMQDCALAMERAGRIEVEAKGYELARAVHGGQFFDCWKEAAAVEKDISFEVLTTEFCPSEYQQYVAAHKLAVGLGSTAKEASAYETLVCGAELNS